MGDFNINLLNADIHGPTNYFINDMYDKSMFSLINATLIDNIYTNNITNRHKSKQGIMYTDISDHLPIYHCLGINKPDEKETFIIKRIITEHTKNNFLEKTAEVKIFCQVKILLQHSQTYLKSLGNCTMNIFHLASLQ